MTVKNPVSLGELARELGINKSKLLYYAKIGVIVPVTKAGRMYIFEREDVIKRLKVIENMQQSKKGLSLSEIADGIKSK